MTLEVPCTAGPPAASEGEALLRLRHVFDQLPAAVCLLRGPDHVCEFANNEYRTLVGDRPIEGLTVEEALPEAREQGFIDLLDNVYRTGEQFVGREARAMIRRGDRMEELFVDFTYQPVRGTGGTVEGILVHAFDVTPAVRSREQLQDALRREQEDRFRQAIDSMIDTVMIAAPVRDQGDRIVDLRVEFVNAGSDEIGKRRPEQLTGRSFTQLWPNIAASGLLAEYIAVVETGEPLVLEGYRYDDDIAGERVDGVFDVRATRLGEDLFVVWRNVTERVTRQRALLESRARLAREREAVAMLQAAILPRELPSLSGIDVAAEYVAASEDMEVGGDWFDVFALPDGAVAVAVGDVAGKGIQAAQIMAQLRTAGRVAALAGQGAAAVLSSQNALMLAAGLGPFATAVFGLYQPATGALSWASAGHPPPLVVSGGRAEFLALSEHAPLGVVDEPGYQATETVLGSGDRLVLYTDGLVERRGESISDGLERLRSLVPLGGPAEATCRKLLDRLVLAGGRGDDVCVVTLDRLSC
jgi:PAS domain-containing protein